MKKTLFSLIIFSSIKTLAQTPTFQWAGQLGGSAQEYMYFASTIDQLSNVYTSGTFLGPCDFDPGSGVYNLNNKGTDGFISKIDASGNFVWAKQLKSGGGCEPWAMTSDNLNNVIVTGNYIDSLDLDPGIGNFYLNSSGNSETFVLKLDMNGNFIWGSSFKGTAPFYLNQVYDIGADAIGNVIVSGLFSGNIDFDPGPGTYTLDSAPAGDDTYIVKLDPSGNLIWAKQFSAWNNNVTSKSLDIDVSGNIIISGEFIGVADFNPSVATYTLDAASGNIFVAKLDANGNLIWAEQLGSNPSGATQCWDLKVSSTGDIYIGGDFTIAADFDPGPGTVNFSSPNLDYYILKLDGAGNYIWAKVTGNPTPNDESVFSLDVDGSGDVYLTGYFQGTVDFDPGPGTYTFSTAFGAYNIYNMKLDASGNFLWANHFVGSWGWGMGICVDAPGNVFTVGCFNSVTDFDPSSTAQSNLTPYGFEDIFVQKMSQSPLGITKEKINNNNRLFPNPNSGQFYFQSDLNGKIEILDLTGRIILNEKIGRGTTKINTGDISNGIYLYCFTGEDEQQQKGKLIIE